VATARDDKERLEWTGMKVLAHVRNHFMVKLPEVRWWRKLQTVTKMLMRMSLPTSCQNVKRVRTMYSIRHGAWSGSMRAN
jgi:hypothetical protein